MPVPPSKIGFSIPLQPRKIKSLILRFGQILRWFKTCSRRVGNSRWWGSLIMVLAGNKAKRLFWSTISQKQFIISIIIIIIIIKWTNWTINNIYTICKILNIVKIIVVMIMMIVIITIIIKLIQLKIETNYKKNSCKNH